ncbi:uncharacterized protein LOC144448030 [Glandiceps talaboti]
MELLNEFDIDSTAIDLSGRELKKVPPDIDNYTKLKELDLSSNKLQGIPSTLWTLQQLTNLDVSENELSTISPDIGQHTKLETLDLSENQLKEIPSTLWTLRQLSDLSMSSNKLSTISPDIGQLTKLKTLDLSGNQLKEIPSTLWTLQQLTKLNMSYNDLSTVSPDIGQLTKLKTLDLSENQLKEIPSTLWTLRQLSDLSMRSNKLSTISPDIGQLTKLKTLDLSENQLKEIPSTLWTLRQLSDLSMRSNKLSTISPDIGQLTKLKTLDLSGNQLKEIPSTLWTLRQLTYLSMSSNKLSTISPDIDQCTKLETLVLSENQLEEIPSTLWTLQQLTDLKVRDNKLSTISPDIDQCTKLETLVLSENQLEEIPSTLWTLKQLTYLYMDSNQLTQLTGLPRSNGAGLRFVTYDLSDNRLTNDALEVLGTFKDLASLEIGQNAISRIPPRFTLELPMLMILNITENPMVYPPVEVCNDGLDAIRQYQRDYMNTLTDEGGDSRQIELMGDYESRYPTHYLPSEFRLNIPESAVTKPITLKVSLVRNEGCKPTLGEYEHMESGVIDISPHTYNFKEGIKLCLTLTADDESREFVILRSDNGTHWEETTGSHENNEFSIKISRLGLFVAISRPRISKINIGSKGKEVAFGDNKAASIAIPPGAAKGSFTAAVTVYDPSHFLDNVETKADEGSSGDVSYGTLLYVKGVSGKITNLSKPVTITLKSPPSSQTKENKQGSPVTKSTQELRILKDVKDDNTWIDITSELSSSIAVRNEFVSFQVNSFSGYIICKSPRGRRNVTTLTAGRVRMARRKKTHWFKIILLQFLKDESALLVDIFKRENEEEILEKWKDKCYESFYNIASCDIELHSGENIFIKVSDEFCLKGSTEKRVRYNADNHWLVSIETKGGLSSEDCKKDYMKFYKMQKGNKETEITSLPFRIEGKTSFQSNRGDLQGGTIDDNTLFTVSHKIYWKEWKPVARGLGLSEIDIDAIEHDHLVLREKVYEMLKLWKQKNYETATREVLLEALKKAEAGFAVSVLKKI